MNVEQFEPDWQDVYTPIVEEHKIARAHDLWRAITGDMIDRNIFAPVNVVQIRRYIVATILYAEVFENVASVGPSIGTPGTQKHRRNPMLTVLVQLDELCTRHEESLGISVRTRHKAQPIKRTPVQSKASEFLGEKIVNINRDVHSERSRSNDK